MFATLYHAKDQLFVDSCFFTPGGAIFDEQDALRSFQWGLYEKKVTYDYSPDSDPLQICQDIFDRTQNVSSDTPWNSKAPCRSTAIGDIVIVGQRAFVASGLGWFELHENRETELNGSH